MTPNTFNWQSFKHAVCLSSSPEEVFKKIATPKGITEWFIGIAQYQYGEEEHQYRQAEESIQVNDKYYWEWLAKDFALSGVVLDIVPNEKLTLSFGTGFKVNFQLTQLADQRTKLVLTQSYTQNNETIGEFGYVNCCVCWVFFLTNLKSVVEHGIDLREVKIDDEMLVNR